MKTGGRASSSGLTDRREIGDMIMRRFFVGGTLHFALCKYSFRIRAVRLNEMLMHEENDLVKHEFAEVDDFLPNRRQPKRFGATSIQY